MDMPSKEPVGERLGTIFYLGLFVSWAISAWLSMTMAMLTINEIMIVTVAAGNI